MIKKFAFLVNSSYNDLKSKGGKMMKNPHLKNSFYKLQQDYSLDIIHDVLLGKSNRIICYAEIEDQKNVFLSVISGTFDIIGLKDEPVIRYNDLLKYYDTNNKYAEVASVEKHVDYIFERAYSFKNESSWTMPIITDKRRWITFDIMPIEKTDKVVIIFISEVTENMNTEELNYEKSHRDSLTGLFNKYTLDYHYGERYMWPDFHVLYLDIDDFKPVNDTFGHGVGNDYLRAFAGVLKRYQSGYNCFYRLGGDEFVGLFWESDERIKKIAELIVQETNKLLFAPDQKGITVSIGIMKATKRHDLIRKADQVLYDVKSKGKNQYVYVIEP